MYVLAARRMDEPELRGVQGESRGTALVGNHRAVRLARVDFFSADWMSRLREMDADLMRTSSFQLANEGRMPWEPLQHINMRNRMLAGRLRPAAAPAVASIADEPV